MPFDNLPADVRARLIEQYVIGSVTSYREPATDWDAIRFFRTLDNDTLNIWIGA